MSKILSSKFPGDVKAMYTERGNGKISIPLHAVLSIRVTSCLTILNPIRAGLFCTCSGPGGGVLHPPYKKYFPHMLET